MEAMGGRAEGGDSEKCSFLSNVSFHTGSEN